MTKLTEMRIDFLKKANDFILDIGDEDIYDVWFTYGVPDECDDDMYYDIATDEEQFRYCVNLYKKLKKYAD